MRIFPRQQIPSQLRTRTSNPGTWRKRASGRSHQYAESDGAGRGGYGDVVLRDEASNVRKLGKDIGIVLGNEGREILNPGDFPNRLKACQPAGGASGVSRDTNSDRCLRPDNRRQDAGFI